MSRLLLGCLIVFMPLVTEASEDAYNEEFCVGVEGELETRHEYTYPTGKSYVLVDCETAETVYEGGIDKRSSLDSVQQALFFASLTGKDPAVVIYDTDRRVGKYEHRIQVACELAGVEFLHKQVTLKPLPEGQSGPPKIEAIW